MSNYERRIAYLERVIDALEDELASIEDCNYDDCPYCEDYESKLDKLQEDLEQMENYADDLNDQLNEAIKVDPQWILEFSNDGTPIISCNDSECPNYILKSLELFIISKYEKDNK